MKKKLLIAQLFIAVGALAFLGGTAAANPDGNGGTSGVTDPAILALITNDEVFATIDLAPLLSPPGGPPSQHYGPYPSDSLDSGTCGNFWADDEFDRHFHVKSNHDGTFTIVEQFKNGSFETNAGASPGACEPDGSLGGLIRGGVTGTMHGYLIISNVGPQISDDPACEPGSPPAPCTTGGFLNSHFTCGTGCNVNTFAFEYTAGDQGLLEHHWKNASLDRGGNNGDIRSS